MWLYILDNLYSELLDEGIHALDYLDYSNNILIGILNMAFLKSRSRS